MSKIEVNDTVFFLMENRIQSATVVRKTTIETLSGQFNGVPEKNVKFCIDKNPCGSQYKKTFGSWELFLTKEELINSLIRD